MSDPASVETAQTVTAKAADKPPVLPLSIPFVLMILVLTLLAAMLFIMAFHEIPASNKDLFNIMLGALVGAFSMGVAYFWGSSSNSRAKDETINRITTQQGPTP